MLLEGMTMDEFKRALKKTRTVVIPFGAVEEHGRHLPLSTDTIIATEVLRTIIGKKKVFIAPPMHYGVCTSTGQHPGTITITAGSLRAITYDIVRDSHRKGLRSFILLSGHGGALHINALKEVAEVLVDELEGLRIAVVSPYELLWKEIADVSETTNDSHAGEIETSLMLFLRPDLVKGRSREEYPEFPRPFVVKDKLRYWPGGVWGNPGKATREKGERVVRIVVKKVMEIIEEIEA